jgi:glycerate kinase
MTTSNRPIRRVLVCPQEFKGSMTGAEAAAAIAAGVGRVLPDAEVVVLPMADGGPGTVAIVAGATNSTLVQHTVRGPLGAPVEATYARVERADAPPLAVIEAAGAAGLTLVAAEERDPARATTFGVGEQIRHALESGITRIVLGVGGTGTNDGGAGAAQALGMQLLDLAGAEIQQGGIHLARLARVEAPSTEDAFGVLLNAADVSIAVDVRNVLLGEEGATAVYGAQKGVADWQAPALEYALDRWARILDRDLFLDVTERPGAGAGGGLPAGILAVFPAARIESGAALVGEAIGLRDAIAAADLVVTGEGGLDTQTAYGKAVAHVASLAAEMETPCIAVAGGVEGLPSGIADAEPLAATSDARTEAIEHASTFAADAAARLITRWMSARA